MKSLVVTMDRMSLKNWGCYGSFDEWTPNIDSLAMKSFVFDQAFTKSFSREQACDSVCHDWIKQLQANKILTHFYGETEAITSDWGEKCFDESMLFSGEKQISAPLSETSLSRLTSHACNKLEELSNAKSDNWLMWIGLEGVPDPWFVPEEWLEMIGESFIFDEEEDEKSETESRIDEQKYLEKLFEQYHNDRISLSKDEKEILNQLYSAYSCMLDYYIGMVLKKVRELYEDDVMIILTSGQGELFFYDQQMMQGNNTERLQTEFTEIAFQIPCLIQLPIPKDEGDQADSHNTLMGRTREIVQLPDLVMTILDWFDLSSSSDDSGHSLLPVIREGKSLEREHILIHGNEGYSALRSPDYICYWNRDELGNQKETDSSEDQSFENLEIYARPDDLHDVNNVVSQIPDIEEEFLQIIQGFDE